MNAHIKIINNKIYNVNKDCIVLKRIHVKQCEIAKNDILKNNGSGIHLSEVRAESNDPNKVSIRNNQITEIFNNPGIYLENASVSLEHNEIRKNISHGIYIASTSSNHTNNHIIIMNCSVQENGGSGMEVVDF